MQLRGRQPARPSAIRLHQVGANTGIIGHPRTAETRIVAADWRSRRPGAVALNLLRNRKRRTGEREILANRGERRRNGAASDDELPYRKPADLLSALGG